MPTPVSKPRSGHIIRRRSATNGRASVPPFVACAKLVSAPCGSCPQQQPCNWAAATGPLFARAHRAGDTHVKRTLQHYRVQLSLDTIACRECCPISPSGAFGGGMMHRTACVAALLLAGFSSVANAQVDCARIPQGPERTDCYLGLSQLHRAQSDLAAARAHAQSDAAWYRAITGVALPKPKPRRRE